jgi:hypothetical protein
VKQTFALLFPLDVLVAGLHAEVANKRPNILLILVDDVGYSDIGAFAARANHTPIDQLYYETPRIDRLAREGTLFTQFYACTVCAPTRASLLTGKMNNRLGMCDAYAAVNTTFEKTGKLVPAGAHKFLGSLGWLKGEPTLTQPLIDSATTAPAETKSAKKKLP